MLEAGLSSFGHCVHVKFEAVYKSIGAEIVRAALIQEAIEVKVLKHIGILECTEIKIEILVVSETIEVTRRLVCHRHLLYRL